MTRIIAHVVIKNEQDRLLSKFLDWNSRWWDKLHVYDDRSTDDTALLCSGFGSVTVRPDSVPSFASSEKAIRQAAWDDLDAEDGDWIFCIDADEFFVGSNMSERSALDEYIEYAQYGGRMSVLMHLFDMWTREPSQYRVDGYWNDTNLVRFIRWKPNAQWAENGATYSVPEYAMKSPPIDKIALGSLLHYGYTIPGEIERKHALYQKANHHNPAHIQSIVGTPTLKPYNGVTPWTSE